MSAQIVNISSSVAPIRVSGSTSPLAEAILKNAATNTQLIRHHPKTVVETRVKSSTLLAEGGYNDVWLVEAVLLDEEGEEIAGQRFVLRIPNSESLMPNQLENEVAWLTYIAKNTRIPVPKVYSWSSEYPPFIAMGYVDGKPLCEAWRECSEDQKVKLVEEIAQIIVGLSEIRFDKIGGLTSSHELGATVEGMKIFKGRDKFHSSDHYNIGPYDTVKEYALACYDKEICYYSKAPASNIAWRIFDQDEETRYEDEYDFLSERGPRRDTLLENRAAFVKRLKQARQGFLDDDESLPQEPFVLCHNDLNGRNIIICDKHVVGIIDWEFAGSYPLSELLSGGSVDVIEYTSEADQGGNFSWHDRIRDAVLEVAKAKKWSEEDTDLLMNDGTGTLPGLRSEMFPEYDQSDEDDEGAEPDFEALKHGVKDLDGRYYSVDVE